MNNERQIIETPVFNIQLPGEGSTACRIIASLNADCTSVYIRAERENGSKPFNYPSRVMAPADFHAGLPKRPMAQVFWLLDTIGLKIGPVSTGKE